MQSVNVNKASSALAAENINQIYCTTLAMHKIKHLDTKLFSLNSCKKIKKKLDLFIYIF